ncbi:MAG: Hpt domain-containing protein [Bacteroidota bacterium]
MQAPNIEKLKSLLGNDDNMVAKFLDIFKTETPRQLSKLSDAMSDKDWDTVSTIAHGIKSQVKYLDLLELADKAAEIEVCAEQREDLEHMNMFYGQLEKMLGEVIGNL